jgi:hypothetical protein
MMQTSPGEFHADSLGVRTVSEFDRSHGDSLTYFLFGASGGE